MTEKVNSAQAPKLRNNMTKWEWIRREMSRNKIGYLMVAPYYIVFLIFTVVPVFASLFLSLTQFNMLEPPVFIGVDNYIRLLLDDDIFLLACSNTLIFATMTGPVSYLLCLMFAWFINELTPKIRAFVTLIFYAPSISGQVYLIWQTLFSSDQYGWINGTLMKLGITAGPILWFQDKRYIMTLVIVVALWTSLGTSFLSFIAGFQVVDKSLYEAAAVDGIKNRWQELWYVTLPVMKNQMMFAAIMSITSSFGFGAIVTALCGFPSVDYAAHTIMHHLEDYGGQRWEVGYASAIATILFAIMIGCNLLVNKILSKVGK
ncbi:MAG: sugar ABC transporter permease [Clostridiales bacterium]|nr:sugar ABC transporter permease [Clostridiales bacterium]